MQIRWYFRPHTPGASIREPIAAAFFASDAVSQPGEALVREGIQNSLDATPNGERTLIRVSLINGDNALASQEVSQYFVDANAHYKAEDSGLRPDHLPAKSDNCPVLIFEDFGTYGLLGDPATPFPPKNKGENNFFHFFRAEGRSDKDSTKRGSWGLGKDTFFRASRVNTIFGLTIREGDNRRLLMGKAILKHHYMGEVYCQEGYFGDLHNNHDGIVMPIEDTDNIDEFARTFKLERRQEPGLSIIVPWVHQEISQTAIIKAVFRNYFYPILSGSLDVIVETPGIETSLDKSTLLSEARRLTDDQTILTLMDLAQWVIDGDVNQSRHTIKAPDSNRAWQWNRSLFADEILQSLSKSLENGDAVAIRVPIIVRKKNGSRACSHFDVYMTSDDTNERVRPVFIRDGIIVADVNAPPMRGIRALVVVTSSPLSEFLRQAENPSHTLWHGQQLKDDYVSGVSDLRFVVYCVRRIYDMVIAEDKTEDRRLLSDIFPIASKKGTPVQPPPPSPAYFFINQIRGGFKVLPSKENLEANTLAEIEIAYDVRRGNPLKRYHVDDFRLNRSPIRCIHEGIKILDAVDNRITFCITNPKDFHVTVAGFDPNRQVYVRVNKREDSNADSTN